MWAWQGLSNRHFRLVGEIGRARSTEGEGVPQVDSHVVERGCTEGLGPSAGSARVSLKSIHMWLSEGVQRGLAPSAGSARMSLKSIHRWLSERCAEGLGPYAGSVREPLKSIHM